MRLAFGLVAALSVVLAAGEAAAQANYPDRPVRFIVGFTPGSATDITARLFAQKFSEAWKVPVTVENVPGAGGSVAGDRVAKAAADGATFYWGANGALTINPTLQAGSQTYDVQRDLAPVARLLVMASILAVNNDVPVKSFPELLALAKAQPGKLSYASPGVGTPQHIAGELLKTQAGVNITHVPYRGAVFTDVIGGRVTMTLQNMGTILPHVREGRLRGLAVTSLRRTPVIDLPTVAESGLPGFEATSWFGLMAPAGTPAPIVAKAAQQAIAVAAMPDVRAKLSGLGLDTTADTGNAFAAIIKADTAKWAKVIKDADIKVGN
jgi:tripartite-type tricarboxylate transporter receptor subunit TctC